MLHCFLTQGMTTPVTNGAEYSGLSFLLGINDPCRDISFPLEDGGHKARTYLHYTSPGSSSGGEGWAVPGNQGRILRIDTYHPTSLLRKETVRHSPTVKRSVTLCRCSRVGGRHTGDWNGDLLRFIYLPSNCLVYHLPCQTSTPCELK